MALLGTRRTSLHARGIERRRKLLDAARCLLESRELDEITLGDVAAEAGVPTSGTVVMAARAAAERRSVHGSAEKRDRIRPIPVVSSDISSR